MKKIIASLIILFSVILVDQSFAQWKKIADFIDTDGINYNGEYITCVDFLDLPGPPRIGFVGTDSKLWKTSDGGTSWTCVCDEEVSITDIYFKDSMTGWFSGYGTNTNNTGCFYTTDAGNNWIPLHVPGSQSGYGANSVYFDSLTKRLFLSTSDSGLMLSTDLGNTWNIAFPHYTGGFSFSNDSIGIVAGYGDTTQGIMLTKDGGITWSLSEVPAYCIQPLAIPGTPICFEADYGEIIVRRSDDYGRTWRQLVDFGPTYNPIDSATAPSGTGVIRGDLSHLYIQTDTGMYLSTDEGVTWQYDGGPMYWTNFTNDIFYSANGVTIAGMTYPTGILEDGGLWEEDWPQAGVAQSRAANSNNALSVFPNPFSQSTQITFTSQAAGYAEVSIVNMLGVEVARLFSGELGGGEHNFSWSNPTDLPDGMYECLVRMNGQVETLPVVKF